MSFDLRVMSPIRNWFGGSDSICRGPIVYRLTWPFVARGWPSWIDCREQLRPRLWTSFWGCRPTLGPRLFTRTSVCGSPRDPRRPRRLNRATMRNCAEWCIYAAGGVGGLSSTCECSRTPGRRVPVLVELALEQGLPKGIPYFSLSSMRALPAVEPHNANDLVDVVHNPLHHDRCVGVAYLLKQLRESRLSPVLLHRLASFTDLVKKAAPVKIGSHRPSPRLVDLH